jgi:hypothetical protein
MESDSRFSAKVNFGPNSQTSIGSLISARTFLWHGLSSTVHGLLIVVLPSVDPALDILRAADVFH